MADRSAPVRTAMPTMTLLGSPQLVGLAWVRLAYRLEFDSPLHGIPFFGWGALLRSAFGRALFAVAPRSAELFMGAHLADDATRPWWLSIGPMSADSAGGIRAVDACWTLVGPGIDRLPDVVRAIEDMCRAGFGRDRIPAAPYRAACGLRSNPVDVDVVHAEQVWALAAASPASIATTPLRVRAQSPWSVKHGNEWLRKAMPMDILLKACLTRLWAVRRASGIVTECPVMDAAMQQAWLERAAAWMPLAENTRLAQASRWSTRQSRSLPLSGLVGEWSYASAARIALPWLALAQNLQLGGKTTLGFGQLIIAPDSDVASN